MNHGEKARVLIETAIKMIRKLVVSFVPHGVQQAIKLPSTLEQYLFKALPAAIPPK
jgi:hypothetical protein